MTDEQIKILSEALRSGKNIWWQCDNGKFFRCTHVVYEWREKLDDDWYAEPEPAVFFTTGTCAALINVTPEEFFTKQPFFEERIKHDDFYGN